MASSLRPVDGSTGVLRPRASAGLISRLKNHVVTPGVRPRRIVRGALKGLRMQLDLEHQTQVYLGTYEYEVHQCLGALSRHAVTALDLGAADGAYTLYFLKRTAANAVYAFEPDPAARTLLLANLRLNGLEADERVRVVPRAAGQHDAVETTSLDSMYAEIGKPAVVKIDVEGQEAEVLRGAARLLKRGGVAWIVETHSRELEKDCIRIFETNGLTVRILRPAWWRFALPEGRRIAHNRWLVACEPGQDRA